MAHRKKRPEPELPRVRRASHPSSTALQRLPRTSVLIVEDHRETREMYAEMFGVHGATTIEAGSVSDALRVLESFTPDVVVTDIGMPGTDGYGLLARMRAHPAWARIPRVIASGRSCHAEAATHDPAAVYFEKPVSLVALVDAVRRARPPRPS